MAQIKVLAKKNGYVSLRRVREGTEFFMDEKYMKKDEKGKAILPSWVEAVDPVAKGKKSAPVKEAEIIEEDEVL